MKTCHLLGGISTELEEIPSAEPKQTDSSRFVAEYPSSEEHIDRAGYDAMNTKESRLMSLRALECFQ